MNPLKTYIDAAARGEQARLARALGLSRGAFGDFVSGRRTPTIDLASRLHELTAGAVDFAAWRRTAAGTQPNATSGMTENV